MKRKLLEALRSSPRKPVAVAGGLKFTEAISMLPLAKEKPINKAKKFLKQISPKFKKKNKFKVDSFVNTYNDIKKSKVGRPDLETSYWRQKKELNKFRRAPQRPSNGFTNTMPRMED